MSYALSILSSVSANSPSMCAACSMKSFESTSCPQRSLGMNTPVSMNGPCAEPVTKQFPGGNSELSITRYGT